MIEIPKKLCMTCNEEKPLYEFGMQEHKYYLRNCRSCNREMDKKRNRKKEAWSAGDKIYSWKYTKGR